MFENFPTNKAKTRKCVFGQILHHFENFGTLKYQLWNFISSKDASDVSATADIICRRKVFKNYSKIHTESTKFKNQQNVLK